MSRIDDRAQTTADRNLTTNVEKETGADAAPLTKRLKKLPSQYFKDNFYVTTSGMLWYPAFLCTQMSLGMDRIMFAADYPFEPGKEAVEFMKNLPISSADKEKLFHSNAASLMQL
jgi:predicted TIM-barrel fold metal-dependent hydrolase